MLSSSDKNLIFSPVNDEFNKFATHLTKISKLWQPLEMQSIYYDNLTKKFPSILLLRQIYSFMRKIGHHSQTVGS